MHVSFSTLIKAQVKRIVTALHARTYRRVRRLQKEVTTHRGILRRLERRLDASVPRPRAPRATRPPRGPPPRTSGRTAWRHRVRLALGTAASPPPRAPRPVTPCDPCPARLPQHGLTRRGFSGLRMTLTPSRL